MNRRTIAYQTRQSSVADKHAECPSVLWAGQHLNSVSPLLQTKTLTIGAANNRYEREADEVMRMSVPHDALTLGDARISRKCESCLLGKAACPGCKEDEERIQRKPQISKNTGFLQRQPEEEEEDEDELLQTKAVSGGARAVSSDVCSRIEVLRGGGRPLPESTRAFFEPWFGHDFSQVRVHSSTLASTVANAVHAKAFTLGNNIIFGADQYSPVSLDGQRLLAHELTHVVQQGDGKTRIPAAVERFPTNKSLSVCQHVSPGVLARVEDGNQETAQSSGCRKQTQTPCPGKKGQFTRIDYLRKMYLVNRGTCKLFVAGLGRDGRVINPTQEHFELRPGESGTFVPPEHSYAVAFGCSIGCKGVGLLEHPYLCA